MSLDNEEKENDYSVVTYVDEDGNEQSVKARTVLVTVSLGVLKEGSINFVPNLPEAKQNSIDNMGFNRTYNSPTRTNQSSDCIYI